MFERVYFLARRQQSVKVTPSLPASGHRDHGADTAELDGGAQRRRVGNGLDQFGQSEPVERARSPTGRPDAFRDRIATALEFGGSRQAASGDGHDAVALIELQAPAGRVAEMMGIFEDAIKNRTKVASGNY